MFGVCFRIDDSAAAMSCPVAFLCSHGLSCLPGLMKSVINWTAIHFGKAAAWEEVGMDGNCCFRL